MNELESKELAEKIVKLIYKKKGTDIALLDMQEVSIICDYFILANGSSRPHNRAIANHIDKVLKGRIDHKLRHIQGKKDGGWIVLDYGTIIVHIFLDNLRAYYNLEELWKDAEITYPDFTPEDKKEELV